MIHKETYIQIAGTGIKYSLIKTANIPIAPMRHHFQNCDELLFYTLYFPPIPCEVQIIDVMESSEAESPFNFHKVFLEKGKRKYDFDFSEN